MKKILLLITTLVVSMMVFAEGEGEKKFKFNPEPSDIRPIGLTVGYVQKSFKYGSNIKEHAWSSVPVYYSGDNDVKRQGTLQVGLNINPEFRYGIGLQTGLFYELTPSVSNFDPEINPDLKISLIDHELSIPLRISYRYEIVKNFSVFLFTGPSFDIGLAGTYKKMNENGDWTKRDLYSGAYSDSYGNSEKGEKGEKEIKRFHLMWGVGGGLQFKGLRLTLQGDWGLNNINAVTQKASDAVKLSKPFAINLSYMF